MNFYNPYYYMYPVNSVRSGLFSSLFRGINWSGILNGAQKTLNVVNQAIPLVKQATPMVRNAKTMFKVMNEFKKVDTPNISTTNNEPSQNNISNGPTFFV